MSIRLAFKAALFLFLSLQDTLGLLVSVGRAELVVLAPAPPVAGETVASVDVSPGAGASVVVTLKIGVSVKVTPGAGASVGVVVPPGAGESVAITPGTGASLGPVVLSTVVTVSFPVPTPDY